MSIPLTRHRRVATALSVLALSGLAACGSGGSAAGTSTEASSASSAAATSSAGEPAGEVTLTIKDFAYRTPDKVAPGATVTVMNMDGEAHTVTADEGNAFDVKVDGDGSATLTAPTKPGSYPFHCIYHANMRGTLVVG